MIYEGCQHVSHMAAITYHDRKPTW